MKLKNVIVVYKKTVFQVYGKEKKDKRFLKLLHRNDVTVRRLPLVHQEHEASFKVLRKVLKKLNLNVQYVYRSSAFNERWADLIITLGGDGTFLEAASNVYKKPILGVKSSPLGSVGMFCGIEIADLERTLIAIKSKRIKPVRLTRLKVKLGSRTILSPVTNDVLISHSNPSATSRFLLKINGLLQDVRSSGLWVSPPAGTTGGLLSAGGAVMPLQSKGFGFVVREPYEIFGFTLKRKKGILKSNQKLIVYSKMRRGGIYLDGSPKRIDFLIGQKLQISADAPKLSVFLFNEKRRKQLIESI